MKSAYVVTGTLTDGQTVTLDETIAIPTSRVRVTVEPLVSHDENNFEEVIERIRADQRARGYRPPSRDEVDRRIEEERSSWDD